MMIFGTTFAKRWNEPVRSNQSILARVIVRAIAQYQHLTAGRHSPCRFYPSCSAYAVEAVEHHGAFRGVGLALRRLSRCRPFGPHGVDLVPEPKKDRSHRR